MIELRNKKKMKMEKNFQASILLFLLFYLTSESKMDFFFLMKMADFFCFIIKL